MFRLSRIESDVTATGSPGSFSVPEGTDLRALSATLTPRLPDRSALVLARAGSANGLRRRSEVRATDVRGPDGTEDWDRLEVPFGSEADLAGELLGYADAVVAESPEELVATVTQRLRTIVGEAPR